MVLNWPDELETPKSTSQVVEMAELLYQRLKDENDLTLGEKIVQKLRNRQIKQAQEAES